VDGDQWHHVERRVFQNLPSQDSRGIVRLQIYDWKIHAYAATRQLLPAKQQTITTKDPWRRLTFLTAQGLSCELVLHLIIWYFSNKLLVRVAYLSLVQDIAGVYSFLC